MTDDSDESIKVRLGTIVRIETANIGRVGGLYPRTAPANLTTESQTRLSGDATGPVHRRDFTRVTILPRSWQTLRHFSYHKEEQRVVRTFIYFMSREIERCFNKILPFS